MTMTFDEYWAENEPFGSNPEEKSKLAWEAAIEQCSKIAERNSGLTGQLIAALIRNAALIRAERGKPNAS